MTGGVQQRRLHHVSPLGAFDETQRSSRAANRCCCHPAFRITISGWRFTTRRAKHGVADEDVLHVIDHALAFEDAGEDPDRWLLIGPDPAGNLLEVVVMISAEGDQIAIHAMPMRDEYRRLLGL